MARGESRRTRRRRILRADTLAVLWLTVLVLGALLVDVLPLPDPQVGDYSAYRQGPSLEHLLGTDELGRDIASRLLHGARVSLSVALFAVGVGAVVGTVLGLLAGYFRGLVDTVISIVADVVLAFPTLILIMTIVAIRGASLSGLIVGLGVATVPAFYRMARAHTMTWATREFVTAAHTLGARRSRIILRDVLPAIVPPMLSYCLVIGAMVVMAEGSLSFLGYGVQPPSASWGSMISSGRTAMETSPHIIAAPVITLVITVLAFNSLGNSFERSSRTKEG